MNTFKNLSDVFLCTSDVSKLGPDAVARAIFKKSAIWPQNSTIKIAFQNGDDWEKKWVQKIVVENYVDIINLNLVWVPDKKGDITINFTTDIVANSYLGTESLNLYPSMNLGWLNTPAFGKTFTFQGVSYTIPSPPSDTSEGRIKYLNATNDGTGSTVLHEFGHAFGMVHEHQNPRGVQIEWNEPVLIKKIHEMSGWSEQDIKYQIITKFPVEQSNGSDFDICSIMVYPFSGDMTLNYPQGIKRQTTLSKLDLLWLASTYPITNKKLVCRASRCMYTETPTSADTIYNKVSECLAVCGGWGEGCKQMALTDPILSGSGLDISNSNMTYIIIGSVAGGLFLLLFIYFWFK